MLRLLDSNTTQQSSEFFWLLLAVQYHGRHPDLRKAHVEKQVSAWVKIVWYNSAPLAILSRDCLFVICPMR